MEKLQGPIDSCLVEEDLDENWLEEFVNNFGNNNYRFEDPIYSEEICLPSLEDKMSFLQMLQNVEIAGLTSVTTSEPNYFQLILKLQHEKMIEIENHPNLDCNFMNPSELDSSVTKHVKYETCREEEPVVHVQESHRKCIDENQQGSHLTKTSSNNVEQGNVVPRGKKKRKRPCKPTKNKEEVESQRMTHIAVERNRRRLMNDHLNALRSLMPPTYVPRGDQASIIGGAIDYVKELEQLLESLQAKKRLKQSDDQISNVSASSSTSSSSNMINNMFMLTSPTPTFQFRNFDFNEESNGNSIQVRRNNNNNHEEFSAENRSDLADIKAVVIQNHVNLKIQCHRRPAQLIKAMVAFEELRLTILHLNITSLHSLVHYSFSLKIEDDCKLGSADDVVRAVHHIFSLINLS